MPEYKLTASLTDLTKTRKSLKLNPCILLLNLLKQDYKAGIYNDVSLLIC